MKTARWVKWTLAGAGAAVLAFCLASGLAAARGSGAVSPLRIDDLTALLVPGPNATRYDVAAVDTDPAARLTYTWTLTLQPVDSAGSSPPGDPTAHAALDPGCDNEELPGAVHDISSVGLEGHFVQVYIWRAQGPSFVWYHGAAGTYPDDPAYGCNQALAGPSGNQGVVGVVVSDGAWDCSASINGSTPHAGPDTGPVCSKISPAASPPTVGSAGVETVAHGIPRPTSFAFHAGTVLVSSPGPGGGVFALRGGRATRVAGLPPTFGLAWHGGTLYGTSGTELLAWSGWNGTRFARTKVVFSGPRGLPGLNGVAVGGPGGRIYLAVRLDEAFDHTADHAPYAQKLISLRADGSDVKVVATGLRQPWEIAFARGDPYVTVLGQDNLGPKQPPDYVIRARPGQRYGFPACNWSKPAACNGFTKPFALFPAHSTPMGIAADGSTLYVALAGGTGAGPEVVTIPATGGPATPALTGFHSRVRAVGFAGGYLYAADLGGTVYRVRP